MKASTIPVAQYQNPPPEKHTFAELVEGRENEFPILSVAATRAQPAHDLAVHWTDRNRKMVTNYQQIVRWPYDGRPVAEGSWAEAEEQGKADALTKFLTACEQIVRDGVPFLAHTDRGLPLRSCGGVFYYLRRRELLIGDRIRLRPLREPIYRRFEWWMDHDGNWVPLEHPKGEWIAEFSLQVSDG